MFHLSGIVFDRTISRFGLESGKQGNTIRCELSLFLNQLAGTINAKKRITPPELKQSDQIT
jgi:hypothetical protein